MVPLCVMFDDTVSSTVRPLLGLGPHLGWVVIPSTDVPVQLYRTYYDSYYILYYGTPPLKIDCENYVLTAWGTTP